MSNEYIDMEEYVNRKNIIQQLTKLKKDFSPEVRPIFDVCKHIISEAPAANIAPIGYAYWDYQIDGTHFCSECGTDASYNYEGKEICSSWCPACGCFMTEVRNKDE